MRRCAGGRRVLGEAAVPVVGSVGSGVAVVLEGDEWTGRGCVGAGQAAVGHRGDDPLLAIAPEVYVRRLLGVNVPRHRKVPCPFHEDRHASLHVYETAERGWYCFGACRCGGTIYDLAAPLFGYTARGEDFLRLRSELRRLFGLEPA